MILVMEAQLPAVRCVELPYDPEEARQVARAKDGDHDAFRWLLARYRDRAVRLAAHVLRRADDAEDVAQEAFVKAFRNIRSFREEGRFYTWLYHIVVRVCVDRRRLARWTAEVPLDQCMTAWIGPSSDSRMAVEALLDRLSPPMRAALVLRELEGLVYEEIAEVLTIPVGTVRSRLSSARAQFRTLWEAAQLETDNV